MIELRKITQDNLKKVLDLKVASGQEGYVDSNIYRLAWAYVKETNNEKPPLVFSIYHQDKVIGFVDMNFFELSKTSLLFEEFGDKASYGINHFMIDHQYQGKGFGKQAMQKVIEFLRSFPQGKADSIYLSYWKTNEAARGLYASVGFVETGEIWDGQTGESWDPEREDIERAEVSARLGI